METHMVSSCLSYRKWYASKHNHLATDEFPDLTDFKANKIVQLNSQVTHGHHSALSTVTFDEFTEDTIHVMSHLITLRIKIICLF